MIRSVTRFVALPLLVVEQTADRGSHAGKVDQPEQRKELYRDHQRDQAPKAETPTCANPPETLPTPLVMSLACCPQRVERVAPAVDEVAQIAVPDLVHDLRQVVAEPAHSAADRLHQHQHDGGDDDHDRPARAPWRTAPGSSRTAAPSQVTTGKRTATLKTETKIMRRTFAIDASAHAIATTAGDQQDRLDRDRDLELAATGASSGPRGGPRHPKLRLSERSPAVPREARNARATSTPKMNPPTWAKNATPPPLALRREEPEVGLDELVEEPDAEEDPGGDPHREDEHQREHPRVGIEHEVRAEHGGDRAAGAEHRHPRVGGRAGEQRHRRLGHVATKPPAK